MGITTTTTTASTITTTTTATLTANTTASITDATAHVEEVLEVPEVPDMERSKLSTMMMRLQWNVVCTLIWILQCNDFIRSWCCRNWSAFFTFALHWFHTGVQL